MDRSSREHHNITDRSMTEHDHITERSSGQHDNMTESSEEHHNITERERRELSKNAVPFFSAIDVPRALGTSRGVRRVPRSKTPEPRTRRSSATVALCPNNDESLGPEGFLGTALSSSRTDEGPEEGGSRGPGRRKRRLRRATQQGLRSFLEFVNQICPYKNTPEDREEFENLGARIGVAYRISEDLPCYECTSNGEDLSRCAHNSAEGGGDPMSPENLTWIYPLPNPPAGGLPEDPPPYEHYHLFPTEYLRPPSPLLQAERLLISLSLDSI
ncbi:uncharacterized protein LOC143033240 [Oratosquilla oratoria]|uniref:uncharacterized protein LOC143033240 n=1 Tax=Oratosquilla oratoria TaxID=337810 RepID=UPI003F76BA41